MVSSTRVYVVIVGEVLSRREEYLVANVLSQFTVDYIRMAPVWFVVRNHLPDRIRDEINSCDELRECSVLVIDVGNTGSWSGITQVQVDWLLDRLPADSDDGKELIPTSLH